MLLRKEDSGLLLIDVQEKLTPLVKNAEDLIARCGWLMRLAAELEVITVTSEQYPKGLGETVEPLKKLMNRKHCFDKTDFSCFRDANFRNYLETSPKQQWVLIGIETHVCVMQTAIELREAGYEVFVVVDAVSSRFELDHRYGLKRMKQNGIQLMTSEMVFFEWIGQAGTSQFKALSKAYLQS